MAFVNSVRVSLELLGMIFKPIMYEDIKVAPLDFLGAIPLKFEH